MIRTRISRFRITDNLENRRGITLSSRFLILRFTFRNSYLALLLFFLFSLIISSHANSQKAELPVEDIPIEEGAPTSIQYIYQDRIGYLWFATWSGLYKYDGYSFTSYKHDVEDTTSIFDNTLSVIFEDEEGIMWIGSRLGLERFNPKSETFVHYTPNPSDIGDNKNNQIWAIHGDKNGILLIGSGNGLYKFDKASEKFTSTKYLKTDPSDTTNISVQSFFEDRKGSIWIGTDKGLHKFDLENACFDSTIGFTSHEPSYFNSEKKKYTKYWNYSINRYKPVTSGAAQRINSIIACENGVLWMGTEGGLVEFNPQDKIYTSYLYNPNNPLNCVTSICLDVISGAIWLATLDGLYSFDTNLKKFTRYNSEANCVYSERSGTLWIGTKTGIKKLNQTKQAFKTYPTSVAVQSLTKGKAGTLWLLTLKGQLRFDIQQDKIVSHSSGKDLVWFVWNLRGDISYRRETGGLYILDTLGNLVFSLDPSMEDYINSASYGYNTKTAYWCGIENGNLDLWDHKTNTVKTVKNFKRRINTIFEDSSGLLWISTFMGNLFCYNPKEDTSVEFIYDPRSPSSLSGNIVNTIYEDKKGRLWFATNNGLNRFNSSISSFIHFGEKNGFPSNSIHGILEDEHGYLWISTIKGITKFNPETNKLKNFDVSYGIDPPADISYGISCITSNGEMYFSGAKGFTRFHPDSIKENPFVPPIVITSFKKFDKPASLSDEIRLPYNENFLSFEFAALSYLSNERNQYAYMIEGLDKDWVYSGTWRYASYPNLNPGEYVFRVKGSNNDGVWNEAGTSILIIINSPWWKTTLAYILYSILILSVIYFTWKMQIKKIRMSHEFEMSKFEADRLREVDELKSRFFTNISHEFRTPLTLILGPVKQLIETIKDEKTNIDGRQVRNELKVVHKNANRLLGLVNQLLDISKLESGKMNLLTVPQNIIPLLKALVLSFTSYAERKRIILVFNSTEDKIIAFIDNDKIEKIITNILSNAFKFTPEGGRIEVTVQSKPSSFPPLVKGELKGSSVEISIRDSGIGIPKDQMEKIFDRFYQVDGSHTREQEGTGIGLSLTKELIELHKGRIEIESGEGKGTNITISIPLGKEHLKPEEIFEKEAEKDIEYEKETIDFSIDEFDDKKEKFKIGIDLPEKLELPFLLIVEDNPDVRNYIRNNLNRDYRILEAVDGEDGWNKSIEQTPDLIVSDVMMPKMDGFQLCNKIKTDERTSHIPIILLTAKASSKDKIEGFETGADDYIMKPFEPEELKARIRNLIEQRKRIQEHFQKKGIFELEQTKITSVDKKFLQKTFEIITQNVSDPSFTIETLAGNLYVSKSLLRKKIVSLTGEPPVDLIKRIRLKKAAELIEKNFGNLSEIALEVGFNNPAYFSECFKKQFGVSPSKYYPKNTNS